MYMYIYGVLEVSPLSLEVNLETIGFIVGHCDGFSLQKESSELSDFKILEQL